MISYLCFIVTAAARFLLYAPLHQTKRYTHKNYWRQIWCYRKCTGLDNSRQPSYNSLAMIPFNYALWETLNYGVHVKNQHSPQELEDNIWRETANISRQQLYCASRNIFKTCQACLQAGGQQMYAFVSSKASVIAVLSTDLTSGIFCTW